MAEDMLKKAFLEFFVSRKKSPKVGLFWYYRRRVIGDLYDLDQAELNGSLLGPPSDHYTYWPTIQKALPVLADVEYEFGLKKIEKEISMTFRDREKQRYQSVPRKIFDNDPMGGLFLGKSREFCLLNPDRNLEKGIRQDTAKP